MNDLVARSGMGALEMTEEDLISVLSNSIYPGAKLESIKMVIGYCRAAQLDPLRKPVHIVPMNVKKPGTRDEYEWRDVVMPGVGLYRTDAARTRELAGVSEPEFGPMVDLQLGGGTYTVPEWCRVTVYRIVAGQARAFTAVEYWVENYATQKRDSEAPNAMWKKRPRGQLAKCAEAQALRKAFPEVGAQPTAEEMEGKVIDGEVIDGGSAQPAGFKVGKRGATIEHQPAETIPQQVPAQGEQVPAGEQPAKSKRSTTKSAPKQDDAAPPSVELCGIGEQKYLQNKAAAVGADLDKLLQEMGGLALDKLSKPDFQLVKSKLMALEG